MRCKPGDLAVLVHSRFPENIGLLVKVKAPGYEFLGLPCWITECVGRPIFGQWFSGKQGYTHFANSPDAWLRPIRPDEGTDEMIRIAGKPMETLREALESIRKELA